jgi:hypothetical protein
VKTAQTKELLSSLSSIDQETQDLALWLRAFVRKLYPTANELIYEHRNALAFGWSLTDKREHTFCTMFLFCGDRNVQFGFYWGLELSDPEGLLLGERTGYRYLLVNNRKDFPRVYIKKRLGEAYSRSLAKLKDAALDTLFQPGFEAPSSEIL